MMLSYSSSACRDVSSLLILGQLFSLPCTEGSIEVAGGLGASEPALRPVKLSNRFKVVHYLRVLAIELLTAIWWFEMRAKAISRW